jgi:transposase-like protein
MRLVFVPKDIRVANNYMWRKGSVGEFYPPDLTGPEGIMEELRKRLYERVLGAELTHYLVLCERRSTEAEEGRRRENHCNGTSKTTLISEDGKLEIEIARDRSGEFEPQFIRKGQKRFGGFDTKIIAMYAQMTGRAATSSMRMGMATSGTSSTRDSPGARRTHRLRAPHRRKPNSSFPYPKETVTGREEYGRISSRGAILNRSDFCSAVNTNNPS